MAHTVESTNTQLRSAVRSTQANELSYSLIGLITRFTGDIEFNRYGIISILLLWNVSLAGVAVGLGGMASVVQSALLAIPTLALLTWILAVQPMKTIITIAAVATIIDIAIIFFNVL